MQASVSDSIVLIVELEGKDGLGTKEQRSLIISRNKRSKVEKQEFRLQSQSLNYFVMALNYIIFKNLHCL